MKEQQDNMWSAYLDGELSASESDEFNQSLTDEERDRMSQEIRFERALGEKLKGEVRCPEEVWQQTLQKIQSPKKRMISYNMFGWSWRIAAAVIVLGIWFTFYNDTGLPRPAQSIAELRVSEVPVTVEAVQQYLNEHGINLVLKSIDSSNENSPHFERRLLGAREFQYLDERVIELMFACCGKPVEIVLVNSGGSAADALQRAMNKGKIKTAMNLGDYYIASLSEHPADEFMELLGSPGEA